MYIKLFIMYIEVGPWCALKWFIMYCTYIELMFATSVEMGMGNTGDGI
jgi:hypothetical protein